MMQSSVFRLIFLIFAIGAWERVCHAKEEVTSSPLDKYYDEHASALPEDYPAKAYTTDQMLARLIRIAEGSELSREEIEKEFGVHFVKEPRGEAYVARGQYPLGDKLSSYAGIFPAAFITLNFDKRPLLTENGKIKKPDVALCVDSKKLVQALGPSWRSSVASQSLDGRKIIEISYVKKIGDYEREIYISPHAAMSDPWSSTGDCVSYFFINYRYKSKPAS